MRVLVTGHLGYIGTVMVPMLIKAGHEVIGLDSNLYESCTFEAGGSIAQVPHIRKDVRDAERGDLEGFDAVIHLAALSNDPLGNLNPDTTYRSTTAAACVSPGSPRPPSVKRFLLASSCSNYGLAGDEHGRGNEQAQPGHALWQIQGPVGARHCQARRRRLLPDLSAPGDRLRRVAPHPIRHRAQQSWWPGR